MSREDIVNEILERYGAEAFPSKNIAKGALIGTKQLRVYLGVDPTGPHLHLGHLTNLLVLKKIQQLGHRIIFLIGDFTGRIGDPSDKSAARKQLSEREVKENLKTFKNQAGKIIDLGWGAAEMDFNSRWHSKMRFAEVIGLASRFTVQQMIERDMFQKRIKNRKPIGLHEFLYPLMQGYDSVALNVDAEIGGTDQTFNMLAGRTLLRIYKDKEKLVITTRLLVNPKTGRKLMNKSEGGMINLDDEPGDIFGKLMALPDESIFEVAVLCTEMREERIGELKKMVSRGLNPKDAKTEIARDVVKTIYGEKAAKEAQENFEKLFSKKEMSADLPELKLRSGITALDVALASGALKSKSEARRLIEQGGFEVNGAQKKNPAETLVLRGGEMARIGKKKFFRVRL